MLQFEREAIKQAGYDPTIIVICTLPDKVHLQHNELTADTDVNTQQPVLLLEPPELVAKLPAGKPQYSLRQLAVHALERPQIEIGG